MASRTGTFLFLVIYLALLVGVLVFVWLVTIGNRPPFNANPVITPDEWKNFGGVATVGVTAVSAIMATALSIRNLFAQTAASESLEKVKQVLDKRIPAHGDLYAAALNYYRTLAPLETGNFSYEEVEKAEGKMKESEGLIVYVAKDYASTWRAFWQHVRYMKEHVHKQVPDPDARKQYWRDEVRKLGAELENLESLARKQFV